MSAESVTPVPVAIVGIGCLFPRAQGAERYWAAIREGVDAIGDVPPTHWRPEDYFNADPKAPDQTYARRGGFLDPVPFPALEFGITPHSLEATDTTQLLGLVVAREALESAGYGPNGKSFDRRRTSVILGVTGTLELVIPLGARLGHPHWRRALAKEGVAADVADRVVEHISDSYVKWQEESFPGLLGNVVAGRIANRLDLGGTNCVVDAACASSLSALHLAMMELATGRCDLALSGGMDTFNDIFMYMCFSKTPALSPTGNARPFDAAGDGTILGEGLGCVALKRLADAERDGDTIYAVLKSIGTSSDGKGHAIYAPSAAGQMKCLRQAYELAGVTPESIELVEAHGTGTKAGDLAEITALTEVYTRQDRARWCAIGSVKSQIGHTKAAAGAAGLIKAALALHHKVLPPTIKVETPLGPLADERSPFYVNTLKRPWVANGPTPRRAAVSSFGFGGSNYHCVLEEYTAKPPIDWDHSIEIVAFSDANKDKLEERVREWCKEKPWDEVRRDAAQLRGSFSPTQAHRVVLVLQRDNLDWKKLAELKGDGIYRGEGKPGQLAFLFPGQGSQYPGMLRDLACQFPSIIDVLSEANATGADRLSDRIYPRPAFSEEARKEAEEGLRDTSVAQPALGAVALGALTVLQHFGVTPQATAGHSYGELCALHAAGCFDAIALNKLSRLRGRLMAEGDGDRGSMLAVRGSRTEVEQAMSEAKLELILANRNTPSQWVLSGATAEIRRAAEVFHVRKLACTPLTVAAAFHSPFVAASSERLLTALMTMNWHAPQIPVYSNTTGQAYPADRKAAQALLANQLAQPVQWIDTIERMHAAGVHTFVEVGAANKLGGMVDAILKDRPHIAVSLDASNGRKSGGADLARLLAQLAALGHSMQLTRWEENNTPPTAEKKPTLTVPISGANYVAPRPSTNGTQNTGSASAGNQLVQANRRRESPGVSQNPATHVAGSPGKDLRPPLTHTKPVEKTVSTMTPGNSFNPPPETPDSSGLQQALRVTQEGMAALRQLSEQTAQLHKQFLDGQDRALQVFQALLQQQQAFVQGGVTSQPIVPLALPRPVPPPALPAPAPVKVHSAPVAPPSAKPVATPKPASVPAATNDRVKGIVLGVVAERTGYPAEMLELDMELDADLGIDSIKRVEIFSAVQEKLPDAPPVKSEHLGTLRTLRQVMAFLEGAAPASNGPVQAPAPAAMDNSPIQQIVLGVVAERTGYPAEMLELDMELDADLGIDSIKRVEIFSAVQEKLPDAPPVKSEHLGTLRTLRQVMAFLHGTPNNSVEQPAKEVREPGQTPAPRRGLQRGILKLTPINGNRPTLTLPASGLIWITNDDTPLSLRLAERLNLLGYQTQVIALDESSSIPPELAGLVIVAPLRPLDADWNWSALHLVQRCSPALRRDGCLLSGVIRLDGGFGLLGWDSAAQPTGGGLAGLIKTARHEWPAVMCKVIDLAADWEDVEEAALAVVEELLHIGPTEVGLSSHGPQSLQLSAEPQPPTDSDPLRTGDVVILTGGARGVTAEAAVELARAFRPTLVLLGRSPAPSDEPAWLTPLTTEADIKRAIMKHSDSPLSPRELNERCAEVLAEREIRSTLERIEKVGSKAIYQSVDVRDGEAVRAVVEQIQTQYGQVRGVIHGAGVLADRRIEDKTREQFDRVYGTKVSGLDNLLASIELESLRVLVLFSSSTGQFGRTGQVDYAIANEMLNKRAASMRSQYPKCRVVALNWGPWEGGMVTPALAKVFGEEGVGLIPLAEGAEFLVNEIRQTSDAAAEVVVMGGPWPTEESKPVLSEAGLTLAFEREVSVERMPVLGSHVLNGRAVLPMALVIEWLGLGAMHRYAGLGFHGCEQLRILRGLSIAARETAVVRVYHGKLGERAGMYVVPVELRTVNLDTNVETLHARADILLTAKLPAAPPAEPLPNWSPAPWTDEETYQRLFHGPDLHGIDTLDGVAKAGMTALVRNAPPPSAWLQLPLRQSWLADPLVLDSSFQLMCLWSREYQGAFSLPCSVASYHQFRRSFPKDHPVRAVARVRRQTGQRAIVDIDYLDGQGNVIALLIGYECVADPLLNDAYTHRQLVAPAR